MERIHSEIKGGIWVHRGDNIVHIQYVCTLDKRSLHKHTYEVPFVSMKFSRCSCTYMTFRTGHIFEGYLFVMIAPSVPKHTYCRCGSSLLLLLMTRSASFFNASLFNTFQQGHHSALGRCYSMICRDHGFGLVGGEMVQCFIVIYIYPYCLNNVVWISSV